MSGELLRVTGLEVDFETPFGLSRALRGVSFAVESGEVFGLVGESGCGKTLTGRTILGLVPPNAHVRGSVSLHGRNLEELSPKRRREVRGRQLGMIFQNPGQALNPVFTVGQQMAAIVRHHRSLRGRELRARTRTLLHEVGLPNPGEIMNAYPHHLSGGMQQRVMIAMALASEPELLIADEPTTALDVTIQAQILSLLTTLSERHRVAVLLITHDIGVVAATCKRVAVLYAGRVVEEGPVTTVFSQPYHPYTRGLLASLPEPEKRSQDLPVILGSVPSGLEALPGCAFAPRCDSALPACKDTAPPEVRFEPSHRTECHLYDSEGR